MSIVMIIVTLVIVGFVMWIINNYIPMAAAVKSLLNAVVVILLLLWLLQVFGLIHLGFLGNMSLK